MDAVPSEMSITTSTSLNMPRRSNLCLASWDFLITWTKDWACYLVY